MPETPETTIGRLDERLKSLEKKTDDHHNTVMMELKDIKENINPRLLSLESRVYTKGDFTEFYKTYVLEMDKKLSVEDFKLVRDIVYGAVGIILIAVFSSIIYLVIKQ